MLEDFKKFALKGNVVDLAVGVIIGVAFGKIVDSLVNDLIMPVIGAITGGLDFSNYFFPLSKAAHTDMTYEEAKKVGAVLGYGQFLTVLINFLIISFVLFLVIKQFERLKKPAPDAPPPPPTKSEELLGEIRDLLKKV
ncbi:MAG: large conductance mechanosensitive channel protein MscL [Methylocystis sp.]